MKTVWASSSMSTYRRSLCRRCCRVSSSSLLLRVHDDDNWKNVAFPIFCFLIIFSPGFIFSSSSSSSVSTFRSSFLFSTLYFFYCRFVFIVCMHILFSSITYCILYIVDFCVQIAKLYKKNICWCYVCLKMLSRHDKNPTFNVKIDEKKTSTNNSSNEKKINK